MNQAFKEAVFEQLETKAIINTKEINRARSLGQHKNDDHGELRGLLDSGLVPEQVLAKIICEATKLQLLTTKDFPNQAIENTDVLIRFLRDHEALPISMAAGELSLAMTDPSNNFIIKILEAKLDCKVKPSVAVRSELISHLNRLYSVNSINTPTNTAAPAMSEYDSDSPIVREVHRLLQNAASKRASDIHFEPHANGLQVRYRINGLLENSHLFKESDTDRVIARLKLMAHLDVTEKRRPQNGRFQLPADGRILDFRVSTLPLHNGESVVLRLLEAQLGTATLNELGFNNELANELETVIQAQQGLLLVTGPTGSGKSTTLYSLLSSINKPELKLISIEDPVELNLENVNQIQVDEEHGVGFADALRSVLRQDPDVIMVGEIRDSETAQLAAQAALTGHLVLSTLHTNSAISTLSRLRNLGLADYLIDSSLKGILAQRLLRTSCRQCNAMERRESESATHSDVGHCTSCEGSGFTGRTTLAEYLPFREFHTLHTPTDELNNQLLGQQTMQIDAKRLIDEGLTSQAEVLRVLGNSFE